MTNVCSKGKQMADPEVRGQFLFPPQCLMREVGAVERTLCQEARCTDSGHSSATSMSWGSGQVTSALQPDFSSLAWSTFSILALLVVV